MNMKRFFVVLAVICMIGSSLSHAQEMKKGMSLFNAGLGFLPGIGINASYDHGLVDSWGPGIFTVGGYVGFGTWGKAYPTKSYHSDYRVNAFAFAPRATYRYAIDRSFEVYGAAMFGVVVYSYSRHYSHGSDVFLGIIAGCRYTFSQNVSVFGEIGFNNVSHLSGGLSFAF